MAAAVEATVRRLCIVAPYVASAARSRFLTFPRKGGRDPKGCGRVARVGPDALAPSAASAADVGSASALELAPSLYGFLPPLRGKVRKGVSTRCGSTLAG